MSDPMRTISLKIPPELDALLDELAEARQLSRSAVVREAVLAYAAKRGPSVTQRVDALVTPIDGPRDLSANPRHLDDFGR